MGTLAAQCYKNSSDCQAAKVIVPKWRDCLGVGPPLQGSCEHQISMNSKSIPHATNFPCAKRKEAVDQ